MSRPARLLAFTLLCAGVLVPVQAGVATPIAEHPPQPPAHSARIVTATLPTGERVTLRSSPDGRPIVTVTPNPALASSGSGAADVLTVGSHVYVVPREAAPLLGRGLDLSLFDVRRVAAAEDAGRSQSQPLHVSISGPDARSLPSGLTRAGAGATVADPIALGRALATWGADPASPSPLGSLRLSLGSVLASNLLGASPTPDQPGYHLYTVTVKAIDRDGKPDSGDIGVLTNAEDTNTFIAGQTFVHGRFKFSVPAGTYNVDSFIATSDRSGPSFTLAADPEFDVHHDTTVTLDARAGKLLSVSTPRPSTMVHGELNFQRVSVSGIQFTDALTTFGDAALYAVPTQPVSVGQAYFYPDFRLGDAAGSIDHYLYDLEMPSVGRVPSHLHYRVTTDSLATVHAKYASVLPGNVEEEDRLGLLPWQATTVGSVNPLSAPLARTEYVTARPRLMWFQEVDIDANDGLGRTLSPVAIYRPGDVRHTLWDNQPMGPGVEQEQEVPQGCPACRQNDVMSFSFQPHVDATNDIMLVDQDTSEDLAIYQDGKQIGDTPAGAGAFEVSPAPAHYRVVYHTVTSAPWFPTSTDVTTSWGFDSQERAQGHLPPGWTCTGKDAGEPSIRSTGSAVAAAPVPCVALPILLPHVTTSAGLDGVIPAGADATVHIDVTPQRGAGTDPLAGMKASVSFDGGTHWKAVRAKQTSPTSYDLTYPQPALGNTDGFASLRYTATSLSASTVSETVIHAYPLQALAGSGTPARAHGQGSTPPACATARKAPRVGCDVVLGAANTSGAPQGLTPKDLRAAYRLPASGKGHPTIAVVVPYDDPTLASDLAVYRKQFGVAPCTVANGCLRKVNEQGQASPLPPASPGWALLTALQVDAISATCPECHLLVVETDTDSMTDVGPGLTTAASLGADLVVTGYGTTGEFPGEKRFEAGLSHLGIPFVAASGDYGYGNGAPLIGSISYPSASTHAIAVGGTTLSPASNTRGWSESVYAESTSGCSAYIAKPAWQHDRACRMRTTADVAAVGDPATGLATYDSYQEPGWQQVGGTGLSAAVIAGVYGLAAANGLPVDASSLYDPTARLFDVTTGANGACDGSSICTAVPGYDGPSGVGTPDGISAF